MDPRTPSAQAVELPARVRLMDVSARDGLQSVSGFVEPAKRAEWVRAILEAGVDEVEAASFVNPRRVPQMAGAGEVLAALGEKERERSWSLVPNLRGLLDAVKAGARKVIFFVSATENHSRANLGVGVADAMEELSLMAAESWRQGLSARVALSVAWTDPVEGEVEIAKTASLVAGFASMGFPEVTLCDTHGGASAEKVVELIRAVRGSYPPERLGLHLHDTFGRALGNAHAGMREGVARIDGAVLGLGGCPFIDGAKGNLDMAVLVGMLERSGVGIGTDSSKIGLAARRCGAILEGRRHG